MAEIASPASDPRSLRRHYPHQVQGVSSFSPDSQPRGSPALLFELRIKPGSAKSTQHLLRTSPRQAAQSASPLPANADENLSRRFRGWSFLHIRVKDRLPFPLLHFPNGAGVVGTGLVFPIVCAFDGHLIGRDSCIRPV